MNLHAEPIKQGRKLAQVLEGARTVFLRDGFEGASVDAIAAEAGVSKATLYSYFADKRFLFLEVAKIECQRQADAAIARIDLAGPPARVLYEAAGHMVRFFLSDFGRQVYRMCVAESGRFPEIGRAFYNSGPETARRILSSYLADRVARGELVIEDVDFAAEQFRELCKASLHVQLVFGIKSTFTEAEIDRVIRGAVEMFMARYGAR